MENKHKGYGKLFLVLSMAVRIWVSGIEWIYEYLHNLRLNFISFNLSPCIFIFRFGAIR